jgi:hypothetical protein
MGMGRGYLRDEMEVRRTKTQGQMTPKLRLTVT